MLRELEVHGLPETSESLAWSEAGELCVIAGVKVHLYLPNPRTPSQNTSHPELRPWSVIVLEVNNFDVFEWPNFQQRAYGELSIGEESSESHVVASSWSAPGLSPRNRCVLGILTANGLFCLWDAFGDPAFATSWKRSLVLNKILEDYFTNEEIDNSEISPCRTRVRAAAWSKGLILEDKPPNIEQIFLLTLLNDQGELILLKVRRTGEKQESQYTANVIRVLDLQRELKSHPDGLLDEIQWLGWVREDGRVHATSLCSSEGYTWAVQVQINRSEIEDLGIICHVSSPGIRAVPRWNTSKAQISMLTDQCFSAQLTRLKKIWISGRGEGYPCFVRYYGVANYKDFQALHLSFHARTVVEYLIQIHERSYILFSHSSLKDGAAKADELVFDWEMNTTKPSTNNSAAPWSTIRSKIPELGLEDSKGSSSHRTCAIIIRLYLVLALSRGWSVIETIDLLQNLAQQTVSREVIEVFDEYREESSEAEAIQQIESVVDSLLDTQIGMEICEVCHERLNWSDEHGARCQNGHCYDRCSLTLLAIQRPNISRFCGSCDREYLDSYHVLNEDGSSDPNHRHFLSNLFEAFQDCIYCGGNIQTYS